MAEIIRMDFEKDNMSQDIKLFLREKGRASDRTQANYTSRVNEFLKYMKFGDIDSYIYPDQIKSVRSRDAMEYVEFLERENNAPATISTKIATLKSLWKSLARDCELNVNIWNMTLDKVEDNNHPEFTQEEFSLFLDFCLEQQCKGMEKKLYFETLYVTGLRKRAIQNMTWNDIKQVKDVSGDMIWTINVVDKGNKRCIVPISDDFYAKLLEIKPKNDDFEASVSESSENKQKLSVFSGKTAKIEQNEVKIEQNKVFFINEKTLYKTILQFKEKYGIEKKLVIHSVKSTSLTNGWVRSGGDVKKVQELGHHKDPTITIKKYVRANESLKDKLSYSMDSEIETKEFSTMTKEELLQMIERCSDRTKKELLSFA